jgi:hypothetical protein
LRPKANRDDTIPPRVDEIINSIAERSPHYAQTNHGDNTILVRVDIIIGKSDTDTQFLTLFLRLVIIFQLRAYGFLLHPGPPNSQDRPIGGNALLTIIAFRAGAKISPNLKSRPRFIGELGTLRIYRDP